MTGRYHFMAVVVVVVVVVIALLLAFLHQSSQPPVSVVAVEMSSDSQKNQNLDSENDKMTTPSNNKKQGNKYNAKLLLLVLMVLQNSSTVLVGRHTRSSVAKEDLYVVNHLILITEVGKFILSCILEHAHGGNLVASFQQHVFANPLDALLISIPALLYWVQNSLLYTALSNLSAPLFQVTYQGKLVTTALVSVVMLKRSYSTQQWICLVVLSLGVAIVVLGEDKKKQQEENDESKPSQSLAVGLMAVTIACLSSALAGVYFEKVLKRAGDKTPVSLWMRNIQMAFFSVVIALIKSAITVEEEKNESTTSSNSYLHGFTGWVWVLVGLQAGGGLLVAAVIKYADNVLKGLATGVSVVVATVCSMVLFGTPLSLQFTTGATLILGAVYLFSNKIPGSSSTSLSGKNNVNGNVEMKPLTTSGAVLPK